MTTATSREGVYCCTAVSNSYLAVVTVKIQLFFGVVHKRVSMIQIRDKTKQSRKRKRPDVMRDYMMSLPRRVWLVLILSALPSEGFHSLLPCNRHFSCLMSTLTPKEQSQSTRMHDGSDTSTNENHQSNFWLSVPKTKAGKDEIHRIPYAPSLDADGPLPYGSYRLSGASRNEPVPSCLVTVALDIDAEGTLSLDRGELMTKRMQKLIDCGFTTFQLKTRDSKQQEWAETNVYGKLIRETPLSVMKECHLVLPFSTPSTGLLATPSAVRSSVLDSLYRMGADCIDTLQLKYNDESPYHLDVLDCLHDLQREGLIRSIASKHFSPKLLRSAVACGFAIDSNQIDCSLVGPTEYCSRELQVVCKDLDIPLLLADPLAGGLLSKRHLDDLLEPLPSELTRAEHQSLKLVLPEWAKTHGCSNRVNVWSTFQRTMMPVLADIALKYRVSVSTVAMRWALQLPYVLGVVPSCTLVGDETDDRPYDGQVQLRKVFQLELDEEDMERLWEAAGTRPARDELDLFGVVEEEDGSFLPDFSNTKLWLM